MKRKKTPYRNHASAQYVRLIVIDIHRRWLDGRGGRCPNPGRLKARNLIVRHHRRLLLHDRRVLLDERRVLLVLGRRHRCYVLSRRARHHQRLAVHLDELLLALDILRSYLCDS